MDKLKAIICNGMIRSGSTLLYNVVSNLVETHWNGYRVGFVTANDVADVVNGIPEGRVGVIKTHRMIQGIRELISSGVARAACAFRDVRDILAADKIYTRIMGHSHYSGYGEGVVDLIYQCAHMQSYYLSNMPLRGQSLSPGISLWRYEDMMRHGLMWYVTEMAKWLGMAPTVEFSSALADKMEFKQVETYCAALVATEKGTCFHPNHMLGGDVGIWRMELSAAEVDAMHMLFGYWLRLNGYITSYAE